MSEEKSNDKVWKPKHYRVNKTDEAVMVKILGDAGFTFQAFVEACVQALLRGDPNMMKVMKDFQVLRDIPKESLSEYIISHRERTALLEEFEKKSKV